MTKLLLLQGLPASGKSTRAEEIVKQGNWYRVNKDLIRKMLHFDKFTGINESLTVKAEMSIALDFLKTGLNVVVDDTNLNPKTVARWKAEAKKLGVSCETEKIDTPIQECVDRDRRRFETGGYVGFDVITNMALQYGFYPAKENGFILCDIDGTIADCKHRLHYVRPQNTDGQETFVKDWKGFFSKILEDTPRWEVIEQLDEFKKQGHEIIFVTARPEEYKEETIKWLEEVAVVPDYTTLIMRKSGDKREDTVVKQDMYDRYFKDKYHVHMVIDDRPSVIRMWKENGLDVTDVGPGKEF